jgi:hypothetical protein
MCSYINSGNEISFLLSVSKFTVFFLWTEKADKAGREGTQRNITKRGRTSLERMVKNASL